jgi:hypothetical protein
MYSISHFACMTGVTGEPYFTSDYHQGKNSVVYLPTSATAITNVSAEPKMKEALFPEQETWHDSPDN